MKVESGAESGAESNAASVGEQAIKNEVDPNGKTSVQPAHLASGPMFNLEALVVLGASTAHSIHEAPPVIEDNAVANMTHDLGNMSVDPIREHGKYNTAGLININVLL